MRILKNFFIKDKINTFFDILFTSFLLTIPP